MAKKQTLEQFVNQVRDNCLEDPTVLDAYVVICFNYTNDDKLVLGHFEDFYSFVDLIQKPPKNAVHIYSKGIL